MMNIVFQSILQMSFKASFVIIAVLIARLLLRKAPVKYSYMLWAIVALRLCCPVLPQSPISFFSLEPVKEAESYADAVISEVDTAPHASDAFTPIPETRPEDSIIYPVKIEVFKKPDITLDFIPYIWAIIAVVMLAHGAMTYAKLYKNMADATLLEENVMCSARVTSPFILGFVKPRIYIPYSLEDDALGYVLNHERYHISRGDHILRPVSYLLLCIHWFNPLAWLAFYLMGRDMEMSCDEAVMVRYPRGGAAYSETLLSFAAPRPFTVTPCLSESDVGRRIRHILSWKKPTLWVTAAAVMLCIAACALFVFDGNRSGDPIPSESSSELYNLLEKANQSISLIAAQDLGDYINRVEAVDYQKIRFFELLNDLSEYEYISSEPPLTKGDLIFELYIENGSQYKLYRAYSNALFLEFINPNGIHIVSYYEFNVKEASDILYTLKELRKVIFNSPDTASTFFYINRPHEVYHPARITTAAAERAMTEAIEQNRIYDKDEHVYFTMQFDLPSGTYLFDPNTYAAAVVLPDGTQTVYCAGLWSFDYRLDMATPISGIGAEEALLSLKNSVTWKDDGKVYFMIPATYAPKTDWNIHISGRMVDGNMSMSTHYFEDVNLQKRWQPGYSYSIELNGHESLTMEAYLPDGQGGIHEISIDLMPPANMGRALFEYDGKTYDLALRESSVNALGKTTEIGKYVLVEGHIGPSSSYYGLFNTKTGEFERDILANCIGWNKNDANTIIFSIGDGVYDLSGRRIALIPLEEGKGEYISELDYIEDTTEIGVRIANTFGEDTEVIRLALADNPLSPTNVEMVKAAEKAISERYLPNADAPCLTATYIYSSRGSSVYGISLVQEFEDDSYGSVTGETLEPFMVRFDENMNVLEYTSPSADGYYFRDKMATGRHAEELSMLMESFDSAPGRYRILLEAEIQMQIEAAE